MLSIFRQARAGENLSPAARSFLRLIEGLAATAVVAALPVVSDALSRGTVDWADVGRAALAAASTAALLAILKYAKAHADLPLTPSTPPLASVATPTPLVPPAPLAAVSIADTSAATSPVAPDPNAPIVTPDGAVA